MFPTMTGRLAKLAVILSSPLIIFLFYKWMQKSRRNEKSVKPSEDIHSQKSEDSEEKHIKEINEIFSCAESETRLKINPRIVDRLLGEDDENWDCNLIPEPEEENSHPEHAFDLDFPFLVDQQTVAYIKSPESRIMFIMRGLSGSGKTTIVKSIQSKYQSVHVCSADFYFYKENGQYVFNASKLNVAHSKCQQEAKEACEKGISIVVVDNTNVKRWEMKSYFATAKFNGYITVLVEPTTSWKLNATELSKRNKHGVTREVLEKKVRAFDDMIPFYYAWFVDETMANHLQDQMNNYFQECLKSYPEFRDELLQLAMQGDYDDEDEETENEIVSRFFRKADEENPLLHCTSHFCDLGKTPDAKKYHRKEIVQRAYGKVFSLTITAFTMTKKTLGARVTLDSECKSLYQQPEEDNWKGIKHHNESFAGSTVQSPKQKSHKGKKKGHLKVKTGKVSEENSSDDPEAAVLLNLSGADDTSEACDKISSVEKDNGSSSLNDLFPDVHNTGHARSAHITLKCGRGIHPKQTNFDVLQICDLEMDRLYDLNHFQPVLDGQAYYYGESICCVYLNKPIIIKGLFSGYY